jgi:pimeloyl-ACP methyl ester carboxylesterase
MRFSPIRFFRGVLSLTLACSLTALAVAAGFKVEQGEIDGTKFAIAHPAGAWNHRVLLLAHGFRPADRALVADLFPEHLAYRTLLEEGWIVAKTSFRRNGIIVIDAIADLNALREHIAQVDGAPTRVVLEGESMGGLIVTLLAERDPSHFQGAIGIGAALNMEEKGSDLSLTHSPRVPLIFLTNESELDGPARYVATAAAQTPPELRPALLRVSREGHVNVNQRERLAALRALNAWLDSGRATLPSPAGSAPFADVTFAPQPMPSLVVARPDHRGFETHVTDVSAVYGNVFIDAQPADFADAGIAPKTWFEIEAHGKTYRVFSGHDFNDVKKGDWVVFPNADGFFWLSRNYADAAGTADLHVGDVVSVKRLSDSAPSSGN